MRVLFVMCSIYLIGAVVSDTPNRDSPIRSPSSRSPSKLDSKSTKRSLSSKNSNRFMSVVSGVSKGMRSLSKSNKWFGFNSFKENPSRVVRKALRGDHLDRSPSQMSFSSDISQGSSPSRAETQRQLLRTAYSEFTKECNEKCSLEWGYHYQSDHESYTDLVFSEGTVIPITKGTTVKTSQVRSGLTGLLQSAGEVMRLMKPAYTCFCMTTSSFQAVLRTALKTHPDEFEKSRKEVKKDPEGASKVLDKIYPEGKKGKNFQHVDHETLVRVIVDEMSAHIQDSEFHDSDFEGRIAKLGWCDADVDHGLKRSSSRTPPPSPPRPL
ncbi:unnamed protein product [Bemisia tabaci]|uniref:Uncharacterized protein n=1 Tax=Bemisia tabaci TaxID=7038 RepID=A0A9P0A6S0_BEMTA|nr:unnamed protein product [Bemisia tabaci]